MWTQSVTGLDAERYHDGPRNSSMQPPQWCQTEIVQFELPTLVLSGLPTLARTQPGADLKDTLA